MLIGFARNRQSIAILILLADLRRRNAAQELRRSE